MTNQDLIRAIVRRERVRLEADLESNQRNLDEVAAIYEAAARRTQETRALLAEVRELEQEMTK